MDFIQWHKNKDFYKKALLIALPLMFQQLITSSVNLLDNLMVGQLGDAAIAGVAAANRFYMIATFGIFGIEGAVSIYMAQYFGAKDEEHVKQVFRFGAIAVYVIVLPFILTGLMVPEAILGFFTNARDVIHQGSIYLQSAVIAYLFMALSMHIGNGMRSIGETKIPMYASVVAILLNGVFNYILIFGKLGFPVLGVVGAAYATVIARMIELLILLIVLKNKHFVFNTKISQIFNISPKLAKVMTLKALPLTINELLWSSGMGTLFMFYATRGTEVMAGMSISGSIADLFFTAFGGMAVATTVIVSQTLGANKLDEARESAYNLIRLALMMAVFMGILMFSSTFFVPYLFNVSDLSRSAAIQFNRVQSFMFWVYMLSAQFFFILRAGGDTKSTLVMDAVFMWLVNIPVVGLVATFTSWPVIILYLAGNSTDFIKAMVAYRLFRKEKWLKNLTHSHEEIDQVAL